MTGRAPGLPPPARTARRYPRAAVCSPDYLASSAGLATLARGGNALDAAVAANLVLAVVAPYFCGVGGDVFAIVHDPRDGSAHGYLGAGRAASAASAEDLRRAGHDRMPAVGPHTVTVPGAVDGWFALLDRFGTLPFGDVAADAVALARGGFPMSAYGARATRVAAPLYVEYPGWRAAHGGVGEGETVRRPALARLLEELAAGGRDAYYRGAVAEAIARTVREAGGPLDASDLAAHRGEWAEPIAARYRDVEVLELPPPTQGVTALEALRILDGFPPAAGDPADLDATHLAAEAVKLALADRDAHLGEPAHMALPASTLIENGWVEARRAAVDPARAGAPGPARPQSGGTAYLCAADEAGMLVSLIQSNFLGFGSGLHVPEWGIDLHGRGASFTLEEGTANRLGPSVRPLHTLIPALARRDGRPWLVFGTMGADAQPQVQVQVLRSVVDAGDDPQCALDRPRWRVDLSTGNLHVEEGTGTDRVDGLRRRGHRVVVDPAGDPGFGHAHAIEIGPAGYAAATEPRAEGAAVGL